MDFIDISFLIETFFVVLEGVPVTLLVTIVSLAISVPLAFLLSLTRIYEIPGLNQLSKIYVSFVRGTPMIIQILALYSILPILLNNFFVRNNIDIPIYEVNPIWYAFIIFSFNTTAVLIEVFRSALSTVDRGQLEAAQSVGLTTVQAYRRVIVPQALVSAIPNLCTATVNLIKGTSLGFAFSLPEITLRARVAANASYKYIEAYLDIFIVYLLLCILVEQLFKLVENRLKRYKYRSV